MITIEERLDNWGRCYRARTKRETCCSIEKNYHAPWRQWVELTEIQISAPINTFDADSVEQAWKTLLGKYRLLLRYAYMHNFPPHIVAKKTGVKIYLLDQELRRAKATIEKVLTPIGLYCILAPNSRKTRLRDYASALEAESSTKEVESLAA
jgi:DNA-directed RNA polymerase specialized sigma24 family protein